MDSNTLSTGHGAGPPDGLAGLTAAVEELVAQDLDGLADVVLHGEAGTLLPALVDGALGARPR